MSLIGLDVGTTGCKAIVFDRRGRILGQGTREYPIAFPHPGWAEQDAEQVWELARNALAEAVRLPEERVVPDVGRQAAYEEWYGLYRELYPALMPLQRRM